MKTIKGAHGTGDKYGCGKIVYIDFTYGDCVVVWVQYKRCCKAYKWDGS